MRAAVLERPGRIVVRDVPVPEPAEGEVLVRVRAALTCGTDLKAYQRGHALIPMPGPFGHEYSGVVAVAGRGVRKFRKGDAVMGVHSAPCLRCRYCRKKQFNLCEDLMATKVLGSFAEYLLVPRRIVRQNLFLKPRHLSFAEAAFLEPLACVVHGMEPLRISRGDIVLIIGAGPIGLLHLMLAKSRGATAVLTGLEGHRLKTARRVGADAACVPADVPRVVERLTGGLGADYVFECTGQPQVWEDSVRYVRKGGTVVLFGGCRQGAAVTFDAGRLHYHEITLRGTFHFTPADVRKAYRLLSDRTIKVKSLLSGTCTLSGLPGIFARLGKGEGIKFAVLPS